MNVFIVRTRLQALIVNNILSRDGALDRFCLVVLHQYAKSEDAPEVYALFDSLRERAIFSLDVVSSGGFFKSFLIFYFLNIVSFLSRGTVYLAAFDSYPFALSAIFFPFSRVETFDDGAANILKWSRYYNEEPLSGGGIKRRLLRAIFPEGCAKYLRGRTIRHYTIFKKFQNVVEGNRVIQLDWCWGCLFDNRDAEYLNSDIKVIVLGTPMHDHSDPGIVLEKAAVALKGCDLYICHPREQAWTKSEKIVRLRSPAEAFLQKLANERSIKVFHFNSTVAYALTGSKNIELVDLTGKML